MLSSNRVQLLAPSKIQMMEAIIAIAYGA